MRKIERAHRIKMSLNCVGMLKEVSKQSMSFYGIRGPSTVREMRAFSMLFGGFPATVFLSYTGMEWTQHKLICLSPTNQIPGFYKNYLSICFN